MGDTTKVDEQDRINHELAARYGWHIPPEHVYKDNSRSAWRRDRKRPDWERMLSAVERNELKRLTIYHGDRLVRQPRDLEDLLDLGEPRGLLLLSPTGLYNLADPDHQMMLRWMVARAKNEVDNLSRRMKNEFARRRAEGKVRPGGRGGRSFGFETDGETRVVTEVEMLREAARRVLGLEARRSVALDMNARGFRTTAGGLWNHANLTATLLRPRYAGLMPDGESPAAWGPVYDDDPVKAREIWEGLRALVEAKAATYSYATSARKYLLSGIAKCGPSGDGLEIQHLKHPRSGPDVGYYCPNTQCPKRVRRSVKNLDAFVSGAVLHLLSDETFIANLSAPASDGLAAEINELVARKAEVEAQLANLVDHPSLKPDLLVKTLAGFDRRIEELRSKIALSARRRLLLDHQGLTRQEWEALPLETQRGLVMSSYRVRVLPVTRRGRGFNPDDVDLDLVEED